MVMRRMGHAERIGEIIS